jgi:small subunit ribosomal protein S8
MSMTDPIADMLTRIRNANRANHEKVDIPASKLKQELIRLFKEEGYIRTYKYLETEGHGVIRVYFKPRTKTERVINGLSRISKPGLRVYIGKDEIPRVLGGLGVAVLSTSKGILSDHQARKEGVGGEHMLSIW